MDRTEIIKEIIERVKDTYMIEGESQDKYINKLTANALDEFSLLTGADTVNAKYLFIIEGVVSKRYVRRGSEGLKSESTDGYRVDYKDSVYDFEDYLDILRLEYDIKLGVKSRKIPTVNIL